jgi:hypothetical protein
MLKDLYQEMERMKQGTPVSSRFSCISRIIIVSNKYTVTCQMSKLRGKRMESISPMKDSCKMRQKKRYKYKGTTSLSPNPSDFG